MIGRADCASCQMEEIIYRNNIIDQIIDHNANHLYDK
jgi:hypothetical protein